MQVQTTVSGNGHQALVSTISANHTRLNKGDETVVFWYRNGVEVGHEDMIGTFEDHSKIVAKVRKDSRITGRNAGGKS